MSRWIARSHGRQRIFFFFFWIDGAGEPSAITLFLPRISVVVIAARLPEAGAIGRDEANAREPLRALPEVEVGDDHANGRAVRARERLSFVFVRDEDVRRERFLDRDI